MTTLRRAICVSIYKREQARLASQAHAEKGWRLAAEAMGVTWMDRHGVTQAVPPVMTEHLGAFMRLAMEAPRAKIP